MNRNSPNSRTKTNLNGRCSAAVSSAYLPLDIISLLKPIFSYNFPRLNFPAPKQWQNLPIVHEFILCNLQWKARLGSKVLNLNNEHYSSIYNNCTRKRKGIQIKAEKIELWEIISEAIRARHNKAVENTK